MGRKALFFDLEGTLLSRVTGAIPESAVRALKKTRERGNLVFINSGRSYCFLDGIEEEVECDGVFCGYGTCMVSGGKVVFQHRIPALRGREIRRAMERCRVDGFLESTEGLYMRGERSRMERLNMLWDAAEEEGILNTERWEDESLAFDKICIYADEDSDLDGFFRFLAPDCTVIGRGGGCYECVSKGFSKAAPVAWVQEHFGIGKEDVYVFGDSENDLAMFAYAEHAVLMWEHEKALEPYATFVTKRVEDDGIAYALQALGLC